jgi:hypothetical protein
MPSQKTKHDGLLSGVPGEAFVQGAEGPVVQGPLSGGTECAKPGGTNCIGSVVQEISSLGGMGTRGGKVAAVQFGGSKIDQNQYALSTWDRVRLVKCCEELLACLDVGTGQGKNVTGRGVE